MWCFKMSLLLLLGILAQAVLATLVVRNLPGKADSDTLGEIHRQLSIAAASSPSDSIHNVSASLDSNFINQKLFEYNPGKTGGKNEKIEATTGISITCSQCYTKGQVSASLVARGSFNVSDVFESAEDAVHDVVQNLTSYAEDIFSEFDITDIDSFDIPSPQIDFNIKPPTMPEYQLQATFHDFEVYVALDTVFSAGLTYRMSLYSSTELGAEIGDNLFFGVVFAIDLILSVDSEIEISNGFHLKLDKDVSLEIDLFSEEASHLDFNGGQFEFLPVTILSEGAVLKAVLRLRLRSGFSIKTWDLGLDVLQASVGIESSVYANIAEFSTNVTVGGTDDDGGDDIDDECAIHVVQGYQFAIGAAAGASLVLLDQTWGPTPETEIPIYYTSLSNACASMGRQLPTAVITARAPEIPDSGLQTTTLTTEVTYQAVGCASPALTNCPASLETSTRHTTTTTLVTSVPSGVKATWPSVNSGQPLPIKTVEFGEKAMSMTASSGKPASYIPPPPPSSTTSASSTSTSSAKSTLSKETGGVSNKVIIGVSVGLGLPVLLAIIAGSLFLLRRRQRASAKGQYTTTPTDETLTDKTQSQQ